MRAWTRKTPPKQDISSENQAPQYSLQSLISPRSSDVFLDEKASTTEDRSDHPTPTAYDEIALDAQPRGAGASRMKHFLAKHPSSMKIKVKIPTPVSFQRRSQSAQSLSSSEPVIFTSPRMTHDVPIDEVPIAASLAEEKLELERELLRQSTMKEKMEEEIKRIVFGKANIESSSSAVSDGSGGRISIMERKRRMRLQYQVRCVCCTTS